MAAVKKRKVSDRKNELPDPLLMMAEAKAAKKNAKNVFTAMESLNLLDSNINLEKFSEDKKLAWIIAKYGWKAVSSIRSCLNNCPSSLTDLQRRQLFIKECPDISQFSEISTFLAKQCPNFLFDSPEGRFEMLAPPIGKCSDCGNTLSTYHSCEVKLFTFNGVKTLPKTTLRCQPCNLLYNYSQFGNKSKEGFRYYEAIQPFVEVTDAVFVERRLLEFQCNLA